MASNVGEAVIQLKMDDSGVSAGLSRATSTIEKSGSSSGKAFGGTWAVAAGALLAKGVTKIANVIGNNLGGAINRVDQLNNFPRVMEAVGFSSEQSTESVNQIASALDGLPTSLEDATANVQKLAATMGNLSDGEVNATSVGLALNDMFLAGGKGTAASANALEQYNQMLAAGKVDMQAWNSLVNAAPGQMDQLSKSILGADANQSDLYAAMKAGTVTFDDLNAAIVNLDKQGGEGFSSFRDQAVAATDGIATQMENVGNSMRKVLASALNGEDMTKNIEQLTSRIQTLIQTMGPGIARAIEGIVTQLLPALGNMAVELMPAIGDTISQLTVSILNSLPQIIQVVLDIILAVVDAIVQHLPEILTAITTAILGIITVLTSPENIFKVLTAAITLLTAIVQAIPQIVTALLDALPTIIENIIGVMLDPGVRVQMLDAAIALLKAIIEAIPTIIQLMTTALPELILDIIDYLTNPETIKMVLKGAITLFMALVQAVPQILNSLIQAFGTLFGNLWSHVKHIFQTFAGQFGATISDAFKGAVNGVFSWLENAINGPIGVINGFISTINSAFGGIGVNIGYIQTVSLPRLAAGGYAKQATPAIFGEAGAEVVLPLERNTDNWAGLLASTLVDAMDNQEGASGRPIVVNMTNQINNEMDAEDIGRVLMQSIRRAA